MLSLVILSLFFEIGSLPEHRVLSQLDLAPGLLSGLCLASYEVDGGDLGLGAMQCSKKSLTSLSL